MPESSLCCLVVTTLLEKGRTRRVNPDDFENFDLIIAMDRSNLAALAPNLPGSTSGQTSPTSGVCPELGQDEVPDPYFGNLEGFERVLDLCEAGVKGLLKASPLHTL